MLPAIGLALYEQKRPLRDDPAINAVEITFEQAGAPLRFEKSLRQQGYEQVSLCTSLLSVASPEPPRRELLDAVRAMAEVHGAAAVSSRLGSTRDSGSGPGVGGIVPPTFTQTALDAVCRNIDLIQRSFGRTRFDLENIAPLFQFAGTMSEAEFLSEVLRKTGCGWLLNVTSVYANGRNFGFDAYDFIAEVMPSTSHVQMRLSGGGFDRRSGLFLVSAEQPLPDEVWSLYRHALVLGGHKTLAVFLEGDRGDLAGGRWRQDARHARFIAERVHARQRLLRGRQAIARRA